MDKLPILQITQQKISSYINKIIDQKSPLSTGCYDQQDATSKRYNPQTIVSCTHPNVYAYKE